MSLRFIHPVLLTIVGLVFFGNSLSYAQDTTGQVSWNVVSGYIYHYTGKVNHKSGKFEHVLTIYDPLEDKVVKKFSPAFFKDLKEKAEMIVSYDGEHVLLAHGKAGLYMWNKRKDEPAWVKEFGPDRQQSKMKVIFSYESRLLRVGGSKWVTIFNVRDGEKAAEKFKTYPGRSIDPSFPSRYISLVEPKKSKDQMELKIFQVDQVTGREKNSKTIASIRKIEMNYESPDFALSPDEKRVAAKAIKGRQGYLQVMDLKSGRLIVREKGRYTDFVFSSNNQHLAAVKRMEDNSKQIVVFNLNNPREDPIVHYDNGKSKFLPEFQFRGDNLSLELLLQDQIQRKFWRSDLKKGKSTFTKTFD